MKFEFNPDMTLLMGRKLNEGFKRGELVTFFAHLTPRPLSRESVEFLEGSLARSKAARNA